MASAHAPQRTLCPFNHVLCLGFTAWAVTLSPAVRSTVRSNLFLRTFLSSNVSVCTLWRARGLDLLPIGTPQQPYFAEQTSFARLRPCPAGGAVSDAARAVPGDARPVGGAGATRLG